MSSCRIVVVRLWVSTIARRTDRRSPLADSNATFVVLLVGFGAAVYVAILTAISATVRTTVANTLPVPLSRYSVDRPADRPTVDRESRPGADASITSSRRRFISDREDGTP